MSNVLIVPEKNEKLSPLHIIDVGFASGRIDEAYIVDGWSTDNTWTLLESEIPNYEKKYNKKIKLFGSVLRNTGKGGAMYTGIRKALKDGHSLITFIDADITSITTKWFDILVDSIKKDGFGMTRGYYDRAPFDAQITRHITRPMIAMYFPEGKDVNQPLGGELCMTSEVANHLLTCCTAPPHSWGIDTFMTINTFMGGNKIGEYYLTQKTHGKKSVAELKDMLLDCFDEAAKQVYYHKRQVSIPKFTKSLVKVMPKAETHVERVGEDVRTQKYVNVDFEVESFISSIERILPKVRTDGDGIKKFLKLDFDDEFLLMDLLSIRSVNEFKEKSHLLDKEVWVRTLDTLTRNYIAEEFPSSLRELAFTLWQLRSLSFIINEAKTFDDAEANTAEEAKVAFEYAQKMAAPR